MTEFELAVEAAAARLKPSRLRNVACNAFEHLRKAWRLREIDPEMATFRAITAQEEAASALLLALRHRCYPGARLLNYRDHRHKMAIITIFHAMRESLARHKFPEANISVSTTGRPKITVSFDLGKLTGRDLPFKAELPEPFELYMSSKKEGKLRPHDFKEELGRLANLVGAEDIQAQIERNANRRNEMLYAADTGLPRAECSEAYLVARCHLVTAVVTVLMGVMQTPKQQSLIVQCLEGLLRALNRVESLDFEFPDKEPSFPAFELFHQDDGKFELRVAWTSYQESQWRYRNADRWPRLKGVAFYS